MKVYIPCHKECFIPEVSFFTPIQVGAALSNKHFPDMLHDNDGDNISSKNPSYCELTAQYWVWKNDNDSDYVGFFHYRRFLSFNKNKQIQDEWGNIDYAEPLYAADLSNLELNENAAYELFKEYDIVAPCRKLPYEKNVISHYEKGDGQHIEDLEAAVAVLKEKYPEYADSADKYLNSNTVFECNMYVMKNQLYKEYASWLFDILFETENRIDFTYFNQTELRVMGFLSERLFGIWVTYQREKKGLKVFETQKAYFRNTDLPVSSIYPKKDSVVAVLACNDVYVPYLSVMLASIIENASDSRNYELYLLTTDISAKNQAKLKKYVESKNNFKFNCVNVESMVKTSDLFVHTHISVETYYRFLILKLFPDTPKVLYLDCDMVCESDIAELYDTDVEGKYLAACRDIDLAGAIKNREHKDQLDYVFNTIGSNEIGQYYQAGVLLFNLVEMKKKYSAEQLLQLAKDRHWNYMDQDILNYAYNERIVYLNQEWNVLMDWQDQGKSRIQVLQNAPYYIWKEYAAARNNPKIVHYAGFQKPWDKVDCDYADNFWKYAKLSPYFITLLSCISGLKKKVKKVKMPLLKKMNNYYNTYGMCATFKQIIRKIFKRKIAE